MTRHGFIGCLVVIASAAAAYGAYTCENDATVFGSKDCAMCLDPADLKSYADCRGCCNALAGPVGSPAYFQCRSTAGC